jgi:hypothetical protein
VRTAPGAAIGGADGSGGRATAEGQKGAGNHVIAASVASGFTGRGCWRTKALNSSG